MVLEMTVVMTTRLIPMLLMLVLVMTTVMMSSDDGHGCALTIASAANMIQNLSNDHTKFCP